MAAILNLFWRRTEKAVPSSDRHSEGTEAAVLQVNEGAGCVARCARKEVRWPVRPFGPSFRQGAIPAYSVRRGETASVAGLVGLTGFWSKVEPLVHKGEQLLPTGKVEIAGQRAQVIEEGAPGR